jgi:hypothetical protein
MIKLVILFALTIFSMNSYSCTCLPISVKESIKKSDAIFIGKVLKVDTIKVIPQNFISAKISTSDSGFYTVVHLVSLKVKKIFKGKSISDNIYIITGQGGGDCGYNFELNKYYIIYSKREDYYLVDSEDKINSKYKTHRQAYLTTNDCDRTTENIRKEEKLLKIGLHRKN